MLSCVALIRLEHEWRLTSPAEAEALCRALGEKVVSARGYHTADPARIRRLVDAIEPKREHTISFQGGVIDVSALDAYALTKRYSYFHLRTREATLRAWPELYSWVHASSAERASAVVAGEPTTRIDDETTVVIPKGDLATALRVFHALTCAEIDRGFATAVTTKPELVAMLIAFGARVDVALEIDVAAARSLSELYAGEPHEWQTNCVIVTFPDGAVTGYARQWNLEKERAQWFKRVEKAFRKLQNARV